MRHRYLRQGPIARAAGSLAAVMAVVLLFMGSAIGDDTMFTSWNFSAETSTEHGPIQVPAADGYVGIILQYREPQDTSKFSAEVTVSWPSVENNCPSYPTGQKHTLRHFRNVIKPNVLLFDERTPVLAGSFLYIDVHIRDSYNPSDKFPYKLTVFWERAFPEADPEPSQMPDNPFNLGIISAPFEFSSHIGFQQPGGGTYGGEYICGPGRDNSDFFKFKVKESGYYVVTFASTNDWVVDSPYYCRPVVSGLQEEDSPGIGRYLSSEWWLKEKDHIGPYYLSKEKTYYLDLQSEGWSSTDSPYECNASVLFTIKDGGYTYYVINGQYFPDTVETGELVELVYWIKNRGTIKGNPVVVRVQIYDPWGHIVYTSQKSISLEPEPSSLEVHEFVFDLKIPKSHKNTGIHKIKAEIIENDEVVYTRSKKITVLRKVPPVSAVIEMLLLGPVAP